jgi:hypothetical protein
MDRDFLMDDFNLTGLSYMVLLYEETLDMIQDADELAAVVFSADSL